MTPKSLTGRCLGAILGGMLIASCAMAARVGTVAGGAAIGSLAGPGGAAIGAASGLVAYEAIEGDMLQDRVTEAALQGDAGLTFWAMLAPYLPWIIAFVLLFTPSGPFLLRKLKGYFAKSPPSP